MRQSSWAGHHLQHCQNPPKPKQYPGEPPATGHLLSACLWSPILAGEGTSGTSPRLLHLPSAWICLTTFPQLLLPVYSRTNSALPYAVLPLMPLLKSSSDTKPPPPHGQVPNLPALQPQQQGMAPPSPDSGTHLLMYSPVRMIPHVWHLKQLTCHCFSSARRDWPCLISSLQPAQSGGGREEGGRMKTLLPRGDPFFSTGGKMPPSCPFPQGARRKAACWSWDQHGTEPGLPGDLSLGAPRGAGTVGSPQQ